MNAKEFRIGNLATWVDDIEGQVLRITGIVEPDTVWVEWDQNTDDPDNTDTDITSIKPIPLTDDWLIRAGFDYRNYGNSKLVGIKYRLVLIKYMHNYGTEYLRYNEMDGEWHYDHVRFYKHKIKYLHQLQNLYFALTGSELEINY